MTHPAMNEHRNSPVRPEKRRRRRRRCVSCEHELLRFRIRIADVCGAISPIGFPLSRADASVCLCGAVCRSAQPVDSGPSSHVPMHAQNRLAAGNDDDDKLMCGNGSLSGFFSWVCVLVCSTVVVDEPTKRVRYCCGCCSDVHNNCCDTSFGWC